MSHIFSLTTYRLGRRAFILSTPLTDPEGDVVTRPSGLTSSDDLCQPRRDSQVNQPNV